MYLGTFLGAMLPVLAGAFYGFIGYSLMFRANRNIVLLTILSYAVQSMWFTCGSVAYRVKMGPGILIGISPGGVDLAFQVDLTLNYDTAANAAFTLGFDLLALIILFYLVDQYRFVPEQADRPSEDILDTNT